MHGQGPGRLSVVYLPGLGAGSPLRRADLFGLTRDRERWRRNYPKGPLGHLFSKCALWHPRVHCLGHPWEGGAVSTPRRPSTHSSPDCGVSLSHADSIRTSGSPASPTQTQAEATGVFIQVARLRSCGNRCPGGERGAAKVTKTAGPELKSASGLLAPLLPPTPTLRPEATPALAGTPGPSLLLPHWQRGPWKMAESKQRTRTTEKSCYFPAQLIQTTALPPWPKSKGRTRAAGGLLRK